MQQITIFIGIDPDVKKSGFAVWNAKSKRFEDLRALKFWDLINEIETYTIPIHIRIEAGWLNKKSNYHSDNTQKKEIGEKIASFVGANAQVGKLIAEWCVCNNVEHSLVKPTRRKTTKETFINLTKITDKVNQEIIDAGMLVFGL